MTQKNFYICRIPICIRHDNADCREISQTIKTSTAPSWISCFVTNIHSDSDLKQEVGAIPCYCFITIIAVCYILVTRSIIFFFAYLYILQILIRESRCAITWSWNIYGIIFPYITYVLQNFKNSSFKQPFLGFQ